MPSITSANAVIMLTVPGLFPAPVQIQGFSADNIYDIDGIDTVETSMGVDGKLSGGFVYNPVTQTFTLQADSPSNSFFERWYLQQYQVQDTLIANGVTTLRSINRTYNCTKGFLINLGSAMAPAARILQPRRWAIRWESVKPQPNQPV